MAPLPNSAAFRTAAFLSSSRTLLQINKEERSMSETSTLIGYGGRTIGRDALALVPTPAATETHRSAGGRFNIRRFPKRDSAATSLIYTSPLRLDLQSNPLLIRNPMAQVLHYTFVRRFLVRVVLAVLVSISLLSAQSRTRITQPIDNTDVVRFAGSVHPLANAANDYGRVDRSLPMERMLLVLKSSDEQEAALRNLLNHQHDPDSASFRHWLSPEEFGAKFGTSAEDVAKIIGWLQQQGFRVESVSRGKQFVEFSGTAGQVESTFRTEMHHYLVNGKDNVANASEISLPRALAPVVSGVLSLHNFPKKATHRVPFGVHRDPESGRLAPDYTLSTTQGFAHFLAPGDFAKIYDTAPLLAQKVNGAGVSIAIVGRSNIQLSDVKTFRKIFGLPAKDPVFIVNGMDPGIGPDEVESDLDVEWSGAVAPDATIKFVISGSTFSSDGVDLSIAYIIDNVVAPIMSTSFSQCEAFLGPAGNAFFSNLYRQAAAEGITAFVSTGDNGPAACDPPVSSSPAQNGANVSGLASTPFNIAVGGTQFSENGLDGNYWNANNAPDQSSAIGYIPEAVWNESCDPTKDTTQCGGTNLYFLDASSGGPSSCVQSQVVGNQIVCQAGYPKPSWQAGKWILNDGVRDLPDLALDAGGGHDGYLLCIEGSCQTTESNGQTILQNASVVGGTSASTPSMAGIMALIEQKNGKFQGLANYNFYKLQAGENLSSCNSSKLINPTQPNNCLFQDVTAGNNSVPGQKGYPAKTGYDLPTGLGTVNAANIVAAWSTVRKLASVTSLADGTISAQHGKPIPIDVTVKPKSGTGSPSGDFSLETDKFGSVFGGTLENGSFAGNVANLPGGHYTVKAQYGGDAMFGSSTSGSVPVNINPEGSALNVSGWEVNLAGFVVPLFSPVLYGQPVALQINVSGASGIGTASGSVKILDGATSLGTFPIGQSGNAFVEVDNLPAATGLLVGKHSLRVTYSGDDSFRPSFSKLINFNVDKKSPVTAIRPIPGTVTVGDPIELVLNVGAAGLALPPGVELPSGTVRVFDGNKPISDSIPIVFNGPLGPGVSQAIFRTSSLAVGTHFLTLDYSGDSNYRGVNSPPFTRTAQVTVNAAKGTIPTITLRQSPSTVRLGQSTNYVVTLRPPNSGPLPSGSVSIVSENNLVFAGPVTLSNGNASTLLTFAAAGQYVLAASYSGDNRYSPETSAIVTTQVNPGTPTVTLRRASGTVAANTQTSLTVTVIGAPNDPILASVAPSGTVQFLDSLNDGAPRPLGAPHFLTTGNGGTPTYILPVVLPLGTNLITVQYSGDSNWATSTSNPVTVSVK
jgi:biotin operon repressor